MNETILLWILGIFVTVIILICGALVQHIKECRDVRTLLAEIGSDLKRVQADIGDHDSGMRGDLHEHGRALFHQGGCLWMIAEKVGVELPPRELKL